MQNDCEGGVILESCNENVIEILSDTNIKIKIKKNNRMGTRSKNTLKLDIQMVINIVLLLVISTLELW
jgi:hypothetical protein